MSLASSAARGGAATLGGQLLRVLIQIASITILARLLDPNDYGLFTMVVAVVGVATVLGDFGLSMAAIQSQTITPQQRSNLFWTNAAIGVLLTIVVFGAAPLLAAFYEKPELAPITQVLSLTFVLNSLAAQFRAEVSIKLRFKWLASADILAVLFALPAAVIVAFLGLGYWALVVQQITIAIVTLLVLVYAAAWLPSRPRRGSDMRALYAFGANTLGVQMFTYVTSNVDSILLGRFWGANALGLYDRAYQLFRLPLRQVGAPTTRVAIPILSKLQADERYEAYVLRAQLVLAYGFAGMFFLLASVSDPLIEILLGEGWNAAKPIFAVLAVGGVFQGIGFVYYWVFVSRALTGLQLRWTIVGRSAMVVAIVIGLQWGPLGVALGSTLGLIVNWGLLTAFPMSKTGVSRSKLLQVAARPLLILTPITALSMYISYVLMTDLNPWFEMLVLTGIITAYVGSLFLIPIVRRDFSQIWDVAQRLKRR